MTRHTPAYRAALPTIGKQYTHKHYGKVTVLTLDDNDDRICPFLVKFLTTWGSELSQGINGFKFNTGMTKTPWV